ncbi:hypothetical protein CONLIGDRAFT_633788 [Coniochaeta ligniaria NRRL 30616]|uniref:Uncharacterized protein n=1 Tax=Coniochaeta ligniaria NRRL 30616 TaxID=1408157 RepID=A0A1J7II83_9PEZI|nr:hypothetical protein CONLIGDRAFT_633788 [Coniochaeta ligniaria NRRL 30616]
METSTSPQDGAPSQPTPVTPALIKSFNDYPWVKDRQFLQGLAAMLGTTLPSTDMAHAASISLQARIWWFSTKQGVTMAPDSYTAYLASHPDTPTPEPAILARIEDVQRRMGVTGPSNVPSWQVHAPKADLRVKASDGAAREDGVGDDAPYPEHFKAVIEAVTQGKPVPGIKEIPNTVVRLPGITPVGKMQAPRKPWEKPANGTADATGQEKEESPSLPQDYLDREFPPVDDETMDDQKPEGVAVES